MVGDTRDRKAAQQGRPVMVSEPRTQARTPGGRAKGLNQPKPEQPPSRSVPLQPLLQELGTTGKRRKTALCPLTLPLFVGRGSTAPSQGCQDTGRAPAAGRGHRWWVSVHTLPPDLLQHHQLPHGQQLSMSSGQHQGKPSMEHSSHAAHAPCPARLDRSHGTATLHTATPSEDGTPHIRPQDQSMWKQLNPCCLRDTAMHTDTNITMPQVQSSA